MMLETIDRNFLWVPLISGKSTKNKQTRQYDMCLWHIDTDINSCNLIHTASRVKSVQDWWSLSVEIRVVRKGTWCSDAAKKISQVQAAATQHAFRPTQFLFYFLTSWACKIESRQTLKGKGNNFVENLKIFSSYYKMMSWSNMRIQFGIVEIHGGIL